MTTFAEAGRKGGRARSRRKAKAGRANLAKARAALAKLIERGKAKGGAT
jgi:hypothetical protein